MTTEEYQQACLRTLTGLKVGVNSYNEDLLHAVIGLATETGELQDALKKHLFYGRPLDRLNMIEEAGDILWYLSVLLHALGTDYASVMEANIEKLKIRYPEKFKDVVVRNVEKERKAIKC